MNFIRKWETLFDSLETYLNTIKNDFVIVLKNNEFGLKTKLNEIRILSAHYFIDFLMVPVLSTTFIISGCITCCSKSK